MMAQHVPHQAKDKRRVKVYELRNNDWFDRGTGFCTATYTQVSPTALSPFPSICPSRHIGEGYPASLARFIARVKGPYSDLPASCDPYNAYNLSLVAGKVLKS